MYESIFCPRDPIRNNAMVCCGFRTSEDVLKHGGVYDSEILTDEESPYFADPARGDHPLKDGVEFLYFFEKTGDCRSPAKKKQRLAFLPAQAVFKFRKVPRESDRSRT